MAGYLLDWLALLLRWLHFVAGVAWIGASFYFVWLDQHLTPPTDPELQRRGVGGELWAVHGGGFYNPQKYRVAPPALPAKLYWFKWEAYTTWLSGFALLALLYFVRADLMLIDPAVARLSPAQAVSGALLTLAGAWLLYDGLCRSPLGRHDGGLGLIVYLLLVALAWGLAQYYAARAVYLLAGAVIGTLMAGNVFFVIIPVQKQLVTALARGEAPDPAPGRRGKQRSLHNNYFTLPVLFIMISPHSAFTYGHRYGWALLAGIGAAGVLIRHFFNLR
ncbi:MAG: urate hydroxylase PuuD, partial [Pseudogulbenkiania sp.]|nr:urate hydroxylase PuuD [Pseudogulbenkiania sp.]